MSGFLKHLERWAAATVGAFDDSELALLENVLRVVLVANRLLLARVVGTGEGCAVEHGLLNRVNLVHGLALLVAVFARLLLRVRLAWTADQLVALAAVASINCDKSAVAAEGCLGEHGVWSIVELLQTALNAGPVVLWGCCGHL